MRSKLKPSDFGELNWDGLGNGLPSHKRTVNEVVRSIVEPSQLKKHGLEMSIWQERLYPAVLELREAKGASKDQFQVMGPTLPCPSRHQGYFERVPVCMMGMEDPSCIIVSVGMDSSWAFEHEAHHATPCRIEVLECRQGPRAYVPRLLQDRVRLHRRCFSHLNSSEPTLIGWRELVSRLDIHASPALLRINTDGSEGNLLAHIIESGRFLPHQISVNLRAGKEAMQAAELALFRDYMYRRGGYTISSRTPFSPTSFNFLFVRLFFNNRAASANRAGVASEAMPSRALASTSTKPSSLPQDREHRTIAPPPRPVRPVPRDPYPSSSFGAALFSSAPTITSPPLSWGLSLLICILIVEGMLFDWGGSQVRENIVIFSLNDESFGGRRHKEFEREKRGERNKQTKSKTQRTKQNQQPQAKIKKRRRKEIRVVTRERCSFQESNPDLLWHSAQDTNLHGSR
ncbi:MAG: hypothetical protein Q8P67_16515 [archaeon]|nr:hypothetical protein [archaeon]